MGGVYDVKPLGVLAMIDDGEIDWKLLAVRVDDPKAAACGSLKEVEAAFPGQMDAIREWFRDYKVPDGKPQNAFGLDEKWMPKDYRGRGTTHGWRPSVPGAVFPLRSPAK